MGFMFQQPNLLPWYTVRQMCTAEIIGLSGSKWKTDDELIEMVGMKDYAHTTLQKYQGSRSNQCYGPWYMIGYC